MNIEFTWDEEAKVWVAECEQIGLVLESDSYDSLLKKIELALPEQLALNGFDPDQVFTVHTADRQIAYA